MSNCVDCSGEERHNQNPLDCNINFMQCGNPCGVGPKNTPQCESLPSQIQNFTDQFFGTVVKTEVNGQVVWSLPCQLDVGLPNNPRAEGEGLACYFLRLFRDGIGGLTGPKGDAGTPGTNGANTYTVTRQAFTQPTIENPLLQIVVVPNPSIIPGIGIFIQGSGSYLVTDTDPGGAVFVTLVSPIESPLPVIPPGSLVVPVGVPRAGIGPTGPPGATGPVGPQGLPGIPGSSTTNENGTYSAIRSDGSLPGVFTDYTFTGSWSIVDFGYEKPGFSPLGAATYLVTAVVPIYGEGTVTTADQIQVQLVTSDGLIYFQSTQFMSGISPGQTMLIPLTCVVTTTGSAGQKVQLRGYVNNAGAVSVLWVGTKISWVRIA